MIFILTVLVERGFLGNKTNKTSQNYPNSIGVGRFIILGGGQGLEYWGGGGKFPAGT